MADGSGDARTSIDSLVELLHAKGRMELRQIAAQLGVDPSVVEGWAKVLEAGNLARIVNEVGRMYVEPASVSKEQERSVKLTVDAEKSAMTSTAAAEMTVLNRMSEQLARLAELEFQAEAMFRQKLPNLESQLSRVNRIYSALMAQNAKMERIRKDTESVQEKINKRADEIISKIEVTGPASVDAAGAELAKIREATRLANEFESQIGIINKSKDKAMETIGRSTHVQIKALEKELSRAKQSVDAQIKIYEEQTRKSLGSIREQYNATKRDARSAETFKREMQDAKRALEKARTRFNDEYATIMAGMNANEASLASEIKSMLSGLDSLKATASDAAKLYENLQTAKTDIANVSGRVTTLKAEATKLITELGNLDSMKAPIETKLLLAADIRKRAKELDEKISDTDQEVRNMVGRAGGSV